MHSRCRLYPLVAILFLFGCNDSTQPPVPTTLTITAHMNRPGIIGDKFP